MTRRKPTDPRPNVAAVKALCDAITGGDGTVEIAHAVTLPGRPVTVHLSTEEVAAYLLATEWEENTDHVGDDREFYKPRRESTLYPILLEHGQAVSPVSIRLIATYEKRHPLDVADDIIARRRPAKPKRAKRKGGSDGT